MKSQEKTGQRTKKNKALYYLWENIPRLALVLTICLIVILMGVIGDKKERLAQIKSAENAPEKKLVNSVVLELSPLTIEDSMNLPGVIEPWTKLNLMAKVDGAVTEVLVTEGDTVAKGQVIAKIDADDYRIALEAAQAAYRLARTDNDRDRAMLKKKVISAASLETSNTRVQTAKADLDKAQLLLSRCDITAPMGGIIKRLDAKVGLFLSTGDPVAEILKIDQVKAVIGIPESDVDAVRKIETVDMHIKALANRAFTGTKHYIAPSPDSTAYLYRLELALDNPRSEILPGMFCRAQVVKRKIEGAIAVPLFSIISRNEEQYVYVADEENVVHKKNVVLGVIEKWHVEIIEGLEAGERVLVEGHRDVEDGQQINVIKTITDLEEPLL